ncbi:unnamed protein product [Bursaphelenchus xylophilus]|uniref:(pine wood nematode) hypothetical protein n=1 Tax=Bursaphelenchus xylophilus TaxID=6326 RepID=A0A1I7RL65_BURXY|nr:unnamed protein product [Bursaphelenchus xylophilus]CAG9083396.1 unnamed protein product [Bursaphelenchus xylophilus]
MRNSVTELAQHEEAHMPATEKAAEEVFDDINRVYFKECGFDAIGFELEKLIGEEIEIDELERERFKLKKQLKVVSNKISALIAQNASAFCTQVQQFEDVRSDAGGMIEVITTIREILQKERISVRNSLAILANNRRQQWLGHLKENILTFNTLIESNQRVKELMSKGDFPSAIRLCVEAKNAADDYKRYDAIRDLSVNLAKRLGSMESHIDDALASMTLGFDEEKYQFVYSAYKMLNKNSGAAQKLLSFFHATLQTSARSVIVEFLSRTTELESLEEMSYDELCSSIPQDFVVECSQELGVVLCKILFIYHRILRYHIEDDKRQLNSYNAVEVGLEGPPIVEKDVFQTVMIEGLFGIFDTAAEKYDRLLAVQDFSHLKVDNFLNVLEMTNRFRRFGKSYFQNAYHNLTGTVDKMMASYFERYHKNRMDELKMFLENEAFALCPVPLQFTFFDLPEFHFLKESTDPFDDNETVNLRKYQRETSELSESLILLNSEPQNPFLPPVKEEDEEIRIEGHTANDGISTSSSEESCYMQDQAGMENSLPNVCNSALNLLKIFGRCIQMTSMLHSVADQVLKSIVQLYEYIFYMVFEFFAKDPANTILEFNFCTPRLQNTMKDIWQRLIQSEEHEHDKYPICYPSQCILRDDRETLYGLSERIVAVESVIFLAKQLELLRPVLDSLLPLNKKSSTLQSFYKTSLSATFDLRDAVYGCVVSKFIDHELVIKKIKQVKWDISEIVDHHSDYIQYISKELAWIKDKIDSFSGLVHISYEIRSVIWTHVAKTLFRTLVQGYSEVSKKCSNEGRALMLLDTEHLNKDIESLSGLKPVPFKNHVEDYVKAYYLQESYLPDWISRHSGEYTSPQINAVLSHVSRAGKSRIMNIIEGKILEN